MVEKQLQKRIIARLEKQQTKSNGAYIFCGFLGRSNQPFQPFQQQQQQHTHTHTHTHTQPPLTSRART